MNETTIDGFVDVELIAEGAYGTVYKARRQSSMEVLALKRIKLEADNENCFGQTFLREIAAYRRLPKHPNIISVFEVRMMDSRIYLVMELCANDLKTLLEGMDRHLFMNEFRTISRQFLAGLAHLHHHWILHRDLKSSNILVSHDGIVKLCDFGMAREYGRDGECKTAEVVTLWYRAPELLMGETAYDVGVDMWAVGCLLYELIHSEPPFQGSSEISQLRKVFDLLGAPTDEEWHCFRHLPLAGEINKFDGECQIDSVFAHLPPHSIGALDLIKSCLRYNPRDRPTAHQALAHHCLK
jgi:cell division cycle 2-like protein